MIDYDFLPSSPPDNHDWQYRRQKFDFIWASGINEKGSVTNQHTGGLQLELERCFCSGCWVACIILSAAIVEVHLSYLDQWRKPERASAIESLGVADEWEWLRTRRNNLIHGKVGSDDSRLPASEYRHQRDEMQREAQRAISVALKVCLNNPENS